MTDSDTQALLDADARRRAAMMAGDARTLGELLADELVWTHSSGKTDTRDTFLEGIASGTVTYLRLDVDEVSVSKHGDVFVCHGLLNGLASRDGVEKSLRNRFLTVWVRESGVFRMIAWQSTGA